jgi:putative nucleotidyltransferase with HDIG domain
MSTLDIAHVVKSIRDLPALPSIVLDLIASFEQVDVDITTLAEKLSRDQALAAKTLRLANSSFYGLAAKIKTVKQAIVVLGFDSARTLAVASSMIDSFGDGKNEQIDVAAFWRHSIAVALCAKSIARHLGANQEHAFLAGLLHDIGRLVLAFRFPQQYAQVVAFSESTDTPLRQAEMQVLGTDHDRTGRMLAEAWKFPLVIQLAIGEHHAPGQAGSGDVADIVHVADALVQALDLGTDANTAVPVVLDAAWDGLRLTQEQLYEICRETEGRFEEACRLLM